MAEVSGLHVLGVWHCSSVHLSPHLRPSEAARAPPGEKGLESWWRAWLRDHA